ncbi:MAG: hypothetical protein ACOCTU_00345 [Bacteroidota bacterium]
MPHKGNQRHNLIVVNARVFVVDKVHLSGYYSGAYKQNDGDDELEYHQQSS